MNHYPLILITWKDHTSDDVAWKELDKAMVDPVGLVYTVGWLIREDEERYVTAATIAPDGEGCQFFSILKGTVVEIKRLSKKPRKNNGTERSSPDLPEKREPFIPRGVSYSGKP